MGLNLSVSGEKYNFDLSDYEIRAYKFTYSVPDSQYAKGHNDTRSLKITIDLPRIITNNNETLEKIREWSKLEYEDESFYSKVKICEIYRSDTVREITFPNAFMQHYDERIDTNTGSGSIDILFMQKFDKRINIIIDPFNEVFPNMD